ncbi:hypothetical protein F5Y18DRAFT_427671 [Xylariaceae sp. FL1019]|nr:hypothetical protein F5Y18DRAFT_427671 [Xylariaceae sp. FL1019]
MRFLAVPVMALLATGTIAVPSASSSSSKLEARVDCNNIVPACNGGSVVGQTDCRCPGQVSACDLWSCPGGPPNVMVCGQEGSGCAWI